LRWHHESKLEAAQTAGYWLSLMVTVTRIAYKFCAIFISG